jgi:hypothetical protein
MQNVLFRMKRKKVQREEWTIRMERDMQLDKQETERTGREKGECE